MTWGKILVKFENLSSEKPVNKQRLLYTEQNGSCEPLRRKIFFKWKRTFHYEKKQYFLLLKLAATGGRN